MVPIIEGPRHRVIGVLVLRIDPGTFIYPFLKRWPLPSKTAETLLVRREGSEVLFLNELRFSGSAPLHLRFPLSHSDLPAVRAALGQEGVVEGRDYRDVPVYAALRQVPDSPWALVARMDVSEAFAPVRARVWQLFGLNLILMVTAASALGFLWHQQRLRSLRSDLEWQRERHQAETRYRAIFDNAADGIFQVTPEGQLILANSALARILGFDSSKELISQRSDIARQGYVRPERREDYQRLIEQEGQVNNFEYEVFRKDGSIAWVSETSHAVRNEEGQIGYYEGLLEDITQRKAAAAALEAAQEEIHTLAERLNRLATDSANIGVWDWDLIRDVWYATPIYFTMLGYPAEAEFSDREVWLNRLHPDDRSMVAERIRGVLDVARDFYEYEARMLHADGGYRWVNVLGSVAERDAAGRPTRMMGVRMDITGRKRAEKDLLESRALLGSIINSTSDAIYVKDPQGRYLLFNAAAERVVGKGSSDVLGKDDRALFPAEEAAIVMDGDRRVMEEATIKTYEENVSDAAGRPVTFLSTKGPLYDEGGRLMGMFGIARDITERKKAEEALRDAEEKFRRTFELMPFPITLQTRDGVLLEGSEVFCETAGFLREEVLGRTTMELGLWTDLEQRTGMREAMLRNGRVDALEINFRRRNGEMRIMALSARFLVLEPEPIVLAVAQDVTERKRAEEALRHSEQKFRALFENLTEGVALHELVRNEAGSISDYRILDVNPAYQHHTGLDAISAIGRLSTDVYGTEVPPYLEEYSQVAMGGEPYAFEAFFPPMEKYFRISVISPKAGQFATVFEDITDRRHREEELKQKNAEMERFTYMISHDLKSPLVTVRTFLGYLEQDLAQGKAERAVRDMGFIRDASAKMGRLLEDLLQVSRVGRVVNPPVRMTLADLIQEALAAVAGAISTRGVEVQVLGPAVTLYGDRPRLEDVWQNLVENAVRYMGDQPLPRIELGADKKGVETVFFIRDNGMGIDPRFQAKVFGLFEKLDPASEGTGLGLALAKRIVEFYEGRIWIESEGSGQGTCFQFTLPLALKGGRSK